MGDKNEQISQQKKTPGKWKQWKKMPGTWEARHWQSDWLPGWQGWRGGRPGHHLRNPWGSPRAPAASSQQDLPGYHTGKPQGEKSVTAWWNIWNLRIENNFQEERIKQVPTKEWGSAATRLCSACPGARRQQTLSFCRVLWRRKTPNTNSITDLSSNRWEQRHFWVSRHRRHRTTQFFHNVPQRPLPKPSKLEKEHRTHGDCGGQTGAAGWTDSWWGQTGRVPCRLWKGLVQGANSAGNMFFKKSSL